MTLLAGVAKVCFSLLLLMVVVRSSPVTVTRTGLENNTDTTDSENNTTIDNTRSSDLCASVECSNWYECDASNGQCVRTSCEFNCDSDTETAVCGSDSNTYASACELKKKNCLDITNIYVKHYNRCKSCQDFEEEEVSSSTHFEELIALLNKCRAGTATVPDLLGYPSHGSPKCSSDNTDLFEPLQENQYCLAYWCSTRDGDLIPGTLHYAKIPDCSLRKSCTVGNSVYKDGYKFSGDCGICECLDGEVSCIEDFCGVPGNWTNESLKQLKVDVIHMFYFQYQNYDHTPIDLYYIRENKPAEISDRVLELIFSWKFEHYDKNNDHSLQDLELEHLFKDIYELIKVKTFKVQLRQLLNPQDDYSVKMNDWIGYFTEVDSTSSSTSSGDSTLMKRSLQRILKKRRLSN